MGESRREKGAIVRPSDRGAVRGSGILHGHRHPELLRLNVLPVCRVSLRSKFVSLVACTENALLNIPLAVPGSVLDDRPSHPHNSGTENIGFSPTTQTSRGPSTKRREVFGESGRGED